MRLQTINESLEQKGPTKGLDGFLNVNVRLDEKNIDKVHISLGSKVNSWNAQLNESVSKPNSTKLEALKKDLASIMADCEKRMKQSIDKYGFNQ